MMSKRKHLGIQPLHLISKGMTKEVLDGLIELSEKGFYLFHCQMVRGFESAYTR